MESEVTLLDEIKIILSTNHIKEKAFKNLHIFLDKLRLGITQLEEIEKENQRWKKRLQVLGITEGVLIKYKFKGEIYNIVINRIELNGSFIVLMPEHGGGCVFSLDNIGLILEINGIEYESGKIDEIINDIK